MRSTHPALLLLALLAPLALHAQESRVHYTVSIPDPATETFAVTAALHGITPDTLRFLFPVWAPGMYDVIDFGGKVSDMTARDDDGSAVEIVRVASSFYQVVDPPAELLLSYTVDDYDGWGGGAWFGRSDIDAASRFAFANGPALFGYCEGYTRTPHTVSYIPPPGWDLAVALDEEAERDGARTFNAAGYDELIDAPVQMGAFRSWSFMVEGVPHTITLTTDKPIDETQSGELVAMTKRVVEIMSGFFGEIPSDRYLFQFFDLSQPAATSNIGALEHANSSTYLLPFDYGIISTAAHEYWHLWSPKRIHVAALGPFDYRTPPATASLWFHEGGTEYYSHVLLARNGIIAPAELLFSLNRGLAELDDTRDIVPITQFSRELAQNRSLTSYRIYSEGSAIALLLDAEIRAQTGNTRSLDDAMRHFNREYGDHHGGKTFSDDDIIPIIEEATGAELTSFNARYIDGTQRPPIERLLESIGLRLSLLPDIGNTLIMVDNGWKVRNSAGDGMIAASGLRLRDTIIAFIPDGGEPVPVGEIFMDRAEPPPATVSQRSGRMMMATDAATIDTGSAVRRPTFRPTRSWSDTGKRETVVMRAMSDDGSIPPSPRIEAALTERFREWGDRPVTIRFRRGGENHDTTLVMRWRIDHLEIDPDASAAAVAVRQEMFGF